MQEKAKNKNQNGIIKIVSTEEKILKRRTRPAR